MGLRGVVFGMVGLSKTTNEIGPKFTLAANYRPTRFLVSFVIFILPRGAAAGAAVAGNRHALLRMLALALAETIHPQVFLSIAALL